MSRTKLFGGHTETFDEIKIPRHKVILNQKTGEIVMKFIDKVSDRVHESVNYHVSEEFPDGSKNNRETAKLVTFFKRTLSVMVKHGLIYYSNITNKWEYDERTAKAIM